MKHCRCFYLSTLLFWLLLSSCTQPGASTGVGQSIGERPTTTPTKTVTPTKAAESLATLTSTHEPIAITPEGTESTLNEPEVTVEPTSLPPTPTASPTPPFEAVSYTSEELQISFELPSTWVIDEDLAANGVLQVADRTETFYAGSVRTGALITLTGIPNIAENLTEWIAAVTSAFKENYLLDDSQTSLTTPFEINGYSGLRVEQRGGYTVTDPPEAVTLMIVAIEHNDWLVTIATGARNEQLELVEAQFDHLVRTIKITAPKPVESDE